MTRIRVLEAIAGADFSWAPGDLVDLPEEEAAGWADGHRAVLADGQEPDTSPARVEHQPRIVSADGLELEVLSAEIAEIDPPAGVTGGPPWVQWVVTVILPAPPTLGADPAASPVTEEPSAPAGGDADPEEEGDQVPTPIFDPREHSNREVLAYLDTVGEVEARRVLDDEAAGENRAGIRKQRDSVLEAARLRDPAPRRQPGAEVAADDSRGGGRGEQPETRDW